MKVDRSKSRRKLLVGSDDFVLLPLTSLHKMIKAGGRLTTTPIMEMMTSFGHAMMEQRAAEPLGREVDQTGTAKLYDREALRGCFSGRFRL